MLILYAFFFVALSRLVANKKRIEKRNEGESYWENKIYNMILKESKEIKKKNIHVTYKYMWVRVICTALRRICTNILCTHCTIMAVQINLRPHFHFTCVRIKMKKRKSQHALGFFWYTTDSFSFNDTDFVEK